MKSLWDASRLDSRVKTELVQRFVWGVPVYRQRFSPVAGRPATERFYRLIRTAMAHAEQLREPFAGNLECDETTFGGARKGTHALLRRHLLEIIVPDAEATSLLVTGGDTLSTVLDITGAEVLDCIGEAANGVPVSRIRGGRWHDVTLLSKSGGFGDTALLSRLVAQARRMP